MSQPEDRSNTPRSRVGRERDGRWKPGFAPNPTGRPRSQGDFEAQLRVRAPAALERIEEMATKGRGMIRFLANKWLAERAYGKPTQNVDVTAKGAPLDGGRWTGAARASLEAAIAEAEAGALTPTDETTTAELPPLSTEEPS